MRRKLAAVVQTRGSEREVKYRSGVLLVVACATWGTALACYTRTLDEPEPVNPPSDGTGAGTPSHGGDGNASGVGNGAGGSAGTTPEVAPEIDLAGGGGLGGTGGAVTGPTPVIPLRLPSSCALVGYSEQLAPIGNSAGDSTWKQITRPPAGLAFTEATGRIEGVASESGTFDVEFRPSKSEPTLLRIEIGMRDVCWLAHLDSTEPGGSERGELHLRDVLLTRDIALSAEGPILDFAFSPDGRHIAARAGSPVAQQIVLYNLPESPLEQTSIVATAVAFPCGTPAITEPCTIIDYAWSPDSARLAVALSGSTGEQALSGVDVANPAEPWLSVGSIDWEGTERTLQFSEQLIWGGSDWFAFVGLELGVPAADSQVLHTARLEGGALRVWALTSEYGQAPTLRAAPTGLIATYDDSTGVLTSLTRESDVGSGIIPRAFPGMLSPSGRLAALTTEDSRLQIMALADPDGALLESARGACTEVLAWSERIEPEGVERILCRAGQRLRILDHVDANPASAAAARLEALEGIDIGAVGNLLTTPRAFSSSGRFLLLADAEDGRFSLIDLFLMQRDDGLPSGLPAEVEFAPTRDALSLADSFSLIEYELPRWLSLSRAYGTRGGAGPALGPLCNENFWIDPVNWCGAPRIDNHFLYSSDSESMLLEGPRGTLSFADLGVTPQRESVQLTERLAPCAEPCRRKPYAFRP